MTAPRFQPNMAGTASPQQMLRDADDAKKYALALAAADAQAELWQLLATYQGARDANQAAAREVSDEVFERVRRFTFRLNDITQIAARGVHELVPVPRDPQAVRGPYQAQVDYSQSRITDGLAAQDAMVAAALAEATEAEANAIVELAWASSIPAAPDRALQAQVDDALDAIKLALTATAGNSLAANAAAQKILRSAIAENDTIMIFALLGQPARRTLQALQVNRATLARQWGEKMVDAIQADENGVTPLSGDIHGGPFLRIQSTDQALAKLPALAKAYYDRQRQVTDALLATQLVRESMRP